MNKRRHNFTYRIVLVIATVAAGASLPQRATAQGSFVDLVGQYDTPGSARGVAVQGNYAYLVSDGPDSLFVIDVSDPSAPLKVGAVLNLPDRAVSVAGDYAYTVGVSSPRLNVYDVSDPTNPVEVGFRGTNMTDNYGLFISGSIAYVTAVLSDKLTMLNVSDPTNPSLLGDISLGDDGNDVHANAGFAYVATGDSGLRVIDASDPNAPFLAGSYNTPGQATGVFFEPGDHVFVADGASGLRIIDVSDPANPTEVGFYNTPGLANDVAVEEDFAYVADNFLGMRVIYTKDLSNPVELGFYDPGGQAEDITIANNLIYVADQAQGLLIFRKRIVVATLPGESFTGTSIPLTVSDLTGLGVTGIQFVMTYDSTLIDTGTQVLIDSTSLLWNTNWTMEINPVTPGSIAVALAGTDELTGSDTLFNIVFRGADGAPRGTAAELIFGQALFNEGDPLGVAEPVTIIIGFPYGDISGNGAVTAYDASLAFQHLLGIIELNEQQQIKADVNGDAAITELDVSLILQFVVKLIDTFPVEQQNPPLFPAAGELAISDLTIVPSETVTLPVEVVGAEGIVSGSFTLEYDSDVLTLMDVDNASLTKDYLVGEIENEGSVRLLFAGAYAIEGDGQLVHVTFQVADDATEESIIQLTNIRLNAEPILLEGASARLLLSPTGVEPASDGELPKNFSLSHNSPNPFNPLTTIGYALPNEAEIRLNIYDLRGELVATLSDGIQPAGYHQVLWGGANSGGQPVGTGVYFYRLSAVPTNGKTPFQRTRKMILIR